jgi:hypothetical protein
VDWIDDGLLAARTANKTLQRFKDKHAKELEDPETADPDIISELNMLQKNADEAKSKAIWGFANTVAVMLIACAPIPVAGPILGFAGLAILGIVTVRNTYVLAKPYVEKYFSAKKLKQEGDKSQIELAESTRLSPTQEKKVSPAPPTTNPPKVYPNPVGFRQYGSTQSTRDPTTRSSTPPKTLTRKR